MARREIVPFILGLLEPWLNEIQSAYELQPEARRSPTLPVLPEGKVNVVAIVRALGLRPADQKYFHTKPEIRDLVNAFAETQGVKAIGSRAAFDQVDDAVRDKFQQLAGLNRKSEVELTEALRRIEDLMCENEKLRLKCEQYRSALREVYETGDIAGPIVQSLLRAV
jgi:hypothetical protein